MKRMLQIIVLALILLLFSSCCKPKVIIKTEYIKCEYPSILDLNYTNDTNYSTTPIEYEIVGGEE